jgi:hypothetical protein
MSVGEHGSRANGRGYGGQGGEVVVKEVDRLIEDDVLAGPDFSVGACRVDLHYSVYTVEDRGIVIAHEATFPGTRVTNFTITVLQGDENIDGAPEGMQFVDVNRHSG